MNRLRSLTALIILLPVSGLWAQIDPCDPPLVAFISASGPVCAGGAVSISFNLPFDDGGGFDVSYLVGGDAFMLFGIVNGHTVDHSIASSTTATLLLVENNDDDDDECFTEYNQTIPLTVSDPNLTITNQTNPGCEESNGSLNALAAGGQTPYLYSLNGGAFQSSGMFMDLSAGDYTVVAQDAAGCTASIGTSLNSPNSPNLSISNQMNPGCGQVNGSIVTLATGGNQPYQFSLGGTVYQTSPNFSGLPAGTYQVFVKDASNCIDFETVILTDPGANLPQAVIFANETQGCSTNTVFQLTGNLPPGMSGFWTSNGLQNPSPSNPVWTLSDVPIGQTNVTWTLSAPGCPNYDTATLALSVLAPPQANPDGVFTINEGDDAEAMVLQNDVLSASVTVRVLKSPAQGIAYLNNQNTLVYQPNASANGLDTVIYEICYQDCPDICDTASVYFRQLRNDDPCIITGDTSNVFTNGLTPNGDGDNDVLVFRVVKVEDCEINYAKSEIIIYNRWGDIVFEASPYKNDWDGTNRNGKELPPGVYYFVLRVTLDKVYNQFGSVILLR